MNMPSAKEMFIQLINDHRGIIYKICNSYCSNKESREDLAQEIVYNLWKSFRNFNPNLKFSTWMYRIALNVAISFYRKESKSKIHIPISDHLLLFEEDLNANNNTEEDIALLLKFISELKEIDKSVMLLYLDDKSYKEIAAITGITESNVATKINRIKDKLKLNLLTIKNMNYGTK